MSNLTTRAVRLLVISPLFVLMSCALLDTPLLNDGGQDRVTVTVRFTDDIEKECGKGLAGCALPAGGYCVVVVKAPKYLEDIYSFQVLGHEFYHCLRNDYHSPG